jgi:hypothetical protein
MPSLPGFTLPPTYAAHPVWSGSTTQPVRFQPTPKKAAVRLWHRARDFDRRTHKPGQHGGAIGHAALQVLHTLIFDFWNYTTGQLDPSYAAIARKANVCQRTVATALARLKALGLLHWQRRCTQRIEGGQCRLEQETNAYAVLPESQWRGYSPPAEAPAPLPGTWGDHPPLPSVVAQAAAETGDLRAQLRLLDADPKDRLAAALASLGRNFMATPNP